MKWLVVGLLVFATFAVFMALSSYLYEQKRQTACEERGGVPYHLMCFKKDVFL